MKLSFEVTRQDFADFNKFHFIKTRLTRTIITGSLTVVLLQVILNKDGFNLIATIISSLVCVGMYFFLIYRALSRIKNIPQANASVLGHRDFEFSDTQIICKTDKTSSTSDWSTIKKLENEKNAFYLYTDTQTAFLIPKRAFASGTEQNNFERFVMSKIKN